VLTVAEARRLGTEWAAAVARRDEVVRLMHEAGLTKSEIHRVTRLSRATIDRVLSKGEAHVRKKDR
jgi:DNA invertase Pin-like site-specific DNA recombinase